MILAAIGLYVLVALAASRALTGHFVFKHHYRPKGEDWFVWSLGTSPLAAVWPLVLIWVLLGSRAVSAALACVPKIGAEREARQRFAERERLEAARECRARERELGLTDREWTP